MFIFYKKKYIYVFILMG